MKQSELIEKAAEEMVERGELFDGPLYHQLCKSLEVEWERAVGELPLDYDEIIIQHIDQLFEDHMQAINDRVHDIKHDEWLDELYYDDLRSLAKRLP